MGKKTVPCYFNYKYIMKRNAKTMAEYLAPGVYVEEFDSGVKAMEGVGTSTAGFLGLAERGPVTGRPVLLTSFAEYQRRFGGYLSEQEYGSCRFLPNAVEQFFTNGGCTCYVMRVVPEDAAIAQSAEGPIRLTARNPGTWANTMQVLLTRCVRARTQVLAAEGDGRYQLKDAAGFRAGDILACRSGDTVSYHKVTALAGSVITAEPPLPDDAVDTDLVPQHTVEACGVDLVIRGGGQEETFAGCSLNPLAPDYLPAAAEKSTLAALTLTVEDKTDDLLVLLGAQAGDTELCIGLAGGANGTLKGINSGVFNGTDGGPGKRTGIEAFREIRDVSIMAVPGITDVSVQAKLIAHCENLTSRFAVLDAPLDCTSVDALNAHRSAYDTSYAALYAPWVQVYDPLLKRPVFLPPSGSVCGIYARVDIERGVHKAPANEIVKGCTGLAVQYNEAEQSKLNPNGVNLIRAIPGQGIRVWGARTCSSDGNWKYVNVRRLFVFLEESIRANTGWVVYEPNDESLWSRVKGTISLFLETQRRNGALVGSTPDQAYYVKVGTDTMTQDDIRSGRLICEIGVAPVRPGEFAVFRITQTTQSAT